MWERLRRARLDAGLSIEDLAARTKIRPPVIEALELGDVEHSLGDFYTRAALRAIAREVKLDPERIIAEYVAQYEPEPQPPPSVRRDPLMPRPPLIHPLWRIAFVATAAFALVSYLTSRSTPTSAPEPGAVGTAGIAAGPADRMPSPPPPPPPEHRSDGLTFELQTKAEVWVSATADGERVLYGLLQPAAHQVIEARNELMLVIGDAGAVEYSINGQPGRALGGPAEARKILLTPNNYAQFVRTQN